MRHTSTPPRDRFHRVRRARLLSNWCLECQQHIDHHALVLGDEGWESHCQGCACTACPDDNDNDTRRTR